MTLVSVHIMKIRTIETIEHYSPPKLKRLELKTKFKPLDSVTSVHKIPYNILLHETTHLLEKIP